MQQQIHSVYDIGSIVRAARKDSKVRIDDLAAVVGLSKQFVNDLELGKDGVQMGKVLQVLGELGLYLYVDAPKSTFEQLEHSQTLIARTKTRRLIRATKQGKSRP